MIYPRNPRAEAGQNKEIGLIILAAGASRRMNQPKQLLEFEGQTLLRRAVETAVETVYRPVVVVLGANFEKMKAAIENLPVAVVFNEGWPEGLSSSIKKGLEKLLEIAPEISAVLLTLADQPYVTTAHLDRFAERFDQTESPVIAARYNEADGVPALFAREIFDDFDKLSGDKGARMIIEKHRPALSTIALPEAAFDIDTPQDFAKLKK
jgi:molybdenum cofactor cytidylyltransferase